MIDAGDDRLIERIAAGEDRRGELLDAVSCSTWCPVRRGELFDVVSCSTR
jgi:hypothetical protein